MSNIKAYWSISLDCICPICENIVDIVMCDDNVLSNVEVCEHETENSTNYEVECPHCGHELLVDFEY